MFVTGPRGWPASVLPPKRPARPRRAIPAASGPRAGCCVTSSRPTLGLGRVLNPPFPGRVMCRSGRQVRAVLEGGLAQQGRSDPVARPEPARRDTPVVPGVGPASGPPAVSRIGERPRPGGSPGPPASVNGPELAPPPGLPAARETANPRRSAHRCWSGSYAAGEPPVGAAAAPSTGTPRRQQPAGLVPAETPRTGHMSRQWSACRWDSTNRVDVEQDRPRAANGPEAAHCPGSSSTWKTPRASTRYAEAEADSRPGGSCPNKPDHRQSHPLNLDVSTPSALAVVTRPMASTCPDHRSEETVRPSRRNDFRIAGSRPKPVPGRPPRPQPGAARRPRWSTRYTSLGGPPRRWRTSVNARRPSPGPADHTGEQRVSACPAEHQGVHGPRGPSRRPRGSPGASPRICRPGGHARASDEVHEPRGPRDGPVTAHPGGRRRNASW